MMNFIGAIAYIGQNIASSIKSSSKSINRVFDYAAAQEILDNVQQIEEKHGREHGDLIAAQLSQILQNNEDFSDLTALLAQIKQAQLEQHSDS